MSSYLHTNLNALTEKSAFRSTVQNRNCIRVLTRGKGERGNVRTGRYLSESIIHSYDLDCKENQSETEELQAHVHTESDVCETALRFGLL